MAVEIMNVLRGEGKTTTCLLKVLSDKNTILVVPDNNSKRFMLNRVQPEVAKTIEKQIYPASYFMDLRGANLTDKKIIIDEVDWCLSKMIGAKITFMTLTDKEKLQESYEQFE